jgi:hypothetical protein
VLAVDNSGLVTLGPGEGFARVEATYPVTATFPISAKSGGFIMKDNINQITNEPSIFVFAGNGIYQVLLSDGTDSLILPGAIIFGRLSAKRGFSICGLELKQDKKGLYLLSMGTTYQTSSGEKMDQDRNWKIYFYDFASVCIVKTPYDFRLTNNSQGGLFYDEQVVDDENGNPCKLVNFYGIDNGSRKIFKYEVSTGNVTAVCAGYSNALYRGDGIVYTSTDVFGAEGIIKRINMNTGEKVELPSIPGTTLNVMSPLAINSFVSDGVVRDRIYAVCMDGSTTGSNIYYIDITEKNSTVTVSKWTLFKTYPADPEVAAINGLAFNPQDGWLYANYYLESVQGIYKLRDLNNDTDADDSTDDGLAEDEFKKISSFYSDEGIILTDVLVIYNP